MLALVPNREESRSELSQGRCNATELRDVAQKIGSKTHGITVSDGFLSDLSTTMSKPNSKMYVRRISIGNTPISCIRTYKRTKTGEVYEKRSSQEKTVRFNTITQSSMQLYSKSTETCEAYEIRLYDNVTQNIKVKKERKEKASTDEKKAAGPVNNLRLKNTVHCNKLFERNKEKNAIGKKRREEIKQRIDNAAMQKRKIEEERMEKALIDEQRLAALVETFRRKSKPSSDKKNKGRISAGHARVSCIGAFERMEKYERDPPPQHTASVDRDSSRGVRSYETINKRCMRLYDAAMQKIKLENERKEKVLTDEQRLATSVERIRRENSVPCIKLYELNKEKNDIGKKTREEIEKRIANSKPSPGHSTFVNKKTRRRSKPSTHDTYPKMTSTVDRNQYSTSLMPPGIQRQHTSIAVQTSTSGRKVNILNARSQVSPSAHSRFSLQRMCDAHGGDESSGTMIGRHSNGYGQNSLRYEKGEVEEKKVFMNEKTKRLSPRFLHLYESGKQKIRTKRKDEEQESPTICRVSGTNLRCKQLYQLSKNAQKLGRKIRKDISKASE